MKDDLLKVLYLKSVNNKLEHPILSKYSIYFSVYEDALTQNVNLIATMKDSFNPTYSQSLSYYLRQFYDEFVKISS